jgi:hypothetical protein
MVWPSQQHEKQKHTPHSCAASVQLLLSFSVLFFILFHPVFFYMWSGNPQALPPPAHARHAMVFSTCHEGCGRGRAACARAQPPHLATAAGPPDNLHHDSELGGSIHGAGMMDGGERGGTPAELDNEVWVAWFCSRSAGIVLSPDPLQPTNAKWSVRGMNGTGCHAAAQIARVQPPWGALAWPWRMGGGAAAHPMPRSTAGFDRPRGGAGGAGRAEGLRKQHRAAADPPRPALSLQAS